jgi:uncharacterized protein YceK
MRLIVMVLVLSILCLSGCGSRESNRIDEKEFISLYADILYITGQQYVWEDSLRYQDQIDSILTEYAVTPESFESTLRYYANDALRWKELIEKTVRELEARRDQGEDSSYEPKPAVDM